MNQFKIDGLTLITDYMPHIETVSVKIMVKVGSRFETIDVSGISHFIEHMAFKGTKTRSKTRIAEEIDITGGSFNAYTSKERTVYYAKVMKNDLDFVLELLADILQNSVFAEEEIENERKVILEERAQIKDSPDDYVFDLFQERLFLDQSLGRPIVGSESFIRSANRKQLLDYIGNYYNRENIIVSCSGNFDEDLFHKMVEQKFSFLQHGNENIFDKGAYVGGDIRLERDLEQTQIVLGFPGNSYRSDDFYKEQVMSVILGGGMSSRLFQEIREKRGLAYHISSFPLNYNDLGALCIYSATNHDSINELIEAVSEQLKIATDSISEAELDRAKKQVKSGLLMAQESSSARAERAAWSYSVFGRVIPIQEAIEKIESVSINDVQGLLVNMFKNQELPTVAAIGRLKNMVPYEHIKEKLIFN